MDQADRTPIVLLGSAIAVMLIALYWIGTQAPADKTTGTHPGASIPCNEQNAASDEECAPAASATAGPTTPVGDNAARDALSGETPGSSSQAAPSTDWLNEDVATKPLNPFQQGLGMDPALTDVFDEPEQNNQ